jgi:mycothiol system anti-sigma-R factor
MACILVRDDFDSLLDGGLDPVRLAEVEAHIETCALCAARLRGERHVREWIASLAADETAPADLRNRIRDGVREVAEPAVRWPSVEPAEAGSRAWGWRPAYGLALAAVVAALAVVWTLSPRGGVDSAVAAGLADDHMHHHGVSEREGMFQTDDPVTLDHWFEQRLGTAVDIPPPPAGARLIGGQVCLVGGRRVAHSVYDVNGVTVSYFVVPEVGGPREPTPGRVEDVNYVAWASEPGGVYVVSSAPSSELMPFHLQ